MKNSRIALAVCLAAGILAGCAGRGGSSSTFDPGSSSIYVGQDGKIQTATVENYEEKDYYNEADFKTFLEAAAAEFNGEHGEGAVTVDSCSLGQGTARVIFGYSSGENLVQFVKAYEDAENDVDSFAVLTPAEAVTSAQTDGINLVKPSDGKAVTAEEIQKEGGRAVVLDGSNPVTVQTAGKILYVSEGISLRDSYTAKTAAGKNYIIFK